MSPFVCPNHRRARRVPSLQQCRQLGFARRYRCAWPGALLLAAGCAAAPAAAAPQEPVPAAPAPVPADPASTLLPLKDVVLFTSGVGYFQRSGAINGPADIPLTFRTGHVQDILKSLVLMDPAGQVQPATYASQEPLEKVLQSFGLDVSANPSMLQLLQQLRGVRVQIQRANGQSITGQVLSTETRYVRPLPRPEPAVEDAAIIPRPVQEVATVNLLTDTGIRSIPLEEIADLQILDPVLAAQLRQALAVLGATRNSQDKTFTVHFGPGPQRNVQVGYVTEAPLWKTSYRLGVGMGKDPFLQGWALVDNPTDQDWNNVHLTLVSGQPISFIQDLYSPLYLSRPVVPPEVQANPYPQLSEDNLLQNAAVAQAKTMPETGAATRRRAPAQAMGGFGGGGFGAGAFSGAASNGAVATETPAPAAPPADAAFQNSGVVSQAATATVGELFEYRVKEPVTLPRQQSAMIPIVTDNITAAKVDVYNADVNGEHPMNAVELTNSTGLHLKAGPVSVFDEGGYAGDARMPEVEPGQKQLLTYAVDLGVAAAREQSGSPEKLVSLSIKHGVLTMTSKQQLTSKYTFKNKLEKDRAVLIEQALRPEWRLVDPAKPDEKTRSYYRFRVAVPAGASKELAVVQEQTLNNTIGLIDADLNLLLSYRQRTEASPAVKAALADVVQRRQHLAELTDALAAQKAQVDATALEQSRIRQNMAQLDRESALYKRYVSELDEQETQLTKVKAEIQRLNGELTTERDALRTAVDNLDAA